MFSFKTFLTNPRRMRRRVTVVVLPVCLSVTMKSAAYLISTSKTKFRRVLYDVFKVFVVWLSLKTLYSRVLTSLLANIAFLASWRAFDGQQRQQCLLFNSNSIILCMVSHRSNKKTDSSLIVAHWQISFLAICAGGHLIRYAIACYVSYILVVTPGIVYQHACSCSYIFLKLNLIRDLIVGPISG
jgi:hypothetical protein